MITTISVIVCLLVLAAICAGAYFWAQKDEDEKETKAIPVDFIVDFHCNKGWFGTFWDEGVTKYGIVSNLPFNAPLKKGDKIRGAVVGYIEANWSVQALDLSNLPADTIVTTYQDSCGRWHCMYPGPDGIAFAGQIINKSNVPGNFLKPNQQWRAINHNDSYFSLA